MTRQKKKIGWLTADDLPEAYQAKEERAFSFDDYLAVKELRRQGYEVKPVVWHPDSKEPDMESLKDLDLLIVRTPQTADFSKFLGSIDRLAAWLKKVERAGIKVANPSEMCLWNSDKHYLKNLEGAGVNIVPAEFIQKGRPVDLGRLMRERGWEKVVVKPAVSIGGDKTYCVKRDTKPPHRELTPEQFDATFKDDGVLKTTPTVSQFRQKFKMLLETQEMIVSPYMKGIEHGEWSFVFLNGKYSHAVRKEPAEDKFLIHTHHGGRINTKIEPPEALVRQAQAMFDKVPDAYKLANRGVSTSVPLYARVDGVDDGGTLKLLELELFEPMLYFTKGEGAVNNMVRAINAYCQASLRR